MAENVEGNVRFTIDASQALATLRNLQKQLAVFHTSMAQAGAGASAESLKLKQNLLNSVNATGAFNASMVKVKSSTEAFTHALENNKMSMGEYFRYAGGATKTFGKMFKTEFSQIQKVAESRVKTLQTRFISMGRDANGALQAIKIRPLALDMENLTTQTMMAAQKQQLFNQLIKQGSTQMLNWGKNTQWAGRQLMVGFTIPLTIFASTAAKAYMEIEKQTIAFKRVYGDFNTTKEQTDAMAASMKSLANEFTQYGVAVADTMDLAAKAAAMGKVGAELQAQVKETTRLAVLGGVEQQQALDTTISLTSAFGIEADKLAGKVDFLNAVENQTVTSISDLTEAIPKAGPVIKQLGGDVEDLTFFLTAMREGGINASEGANALKSGLASIINPTNQASQMLKGFGINIQGILNANKGDVKGLVIDLASALDKLDPTNRAQAIEQMFGKFQFSRISTLFQNVIKDGSQAQKVLELTNASTAELATLSKRELAKISDSPMFKFQKAVTDFQTALAPIGEEFLKAVTPLITFGTDLLKKFDEMGDGAKQVGIYIAAGLGIVGPVFLMITGLVANGIANLIKFGSAISSTFTKLRGGTSDAAMGTEYLTQAQLNELAVTADLDAAHSRLKATFSAEAGAVRSLAAAYREAAKAQSQLEAYSKTTGKYVPATKGRKKYAGGVVSVPGPKGAGDVVPAMLSPGEAVIPAGMAKKYGGLINGMIAGNIPGYSSGLEAKYNADPGDSRRRLGIPSQISAATAAGYGKEAQEVKKQLLGAKIAVGEARRVFSDFSIAAKEGTDSVKSFMANLTTSVKQYVASGQTNSEQLVKSVRGKTGMRTQAERASFAHIGGGVDMTVKDYVSKYGLDGLTPAQRKKFEVAADKSPGKKVSIKHGLALDKLDLGVNSQMAGKGANVSDFLKSYDKTGVEKWSKSIKIGGGNVQELTKSTSELDKEMRRLISGAGKGAKIFDTASQADAYIAATGKKAIALESAYDQAIKNIKDKRVVSSLETARVTSTEVRLGGSQVGERRNTGGRKNANENAALSAVRGNEQSTKAISAGNITTSQARQVQTKIDKNGKPYYILNGTRIPDAVGEAAVAKVEKANAKNASVRARRAAPAVQEAPMSRGQKIAAGAKGLGSKIAGGIRGMGPMGGMLAMGAVGAGVGMIPGMEGFGTAIATIGPLLMMLPGPIAAVAGAFGLLVAVGMSLAAAGEAQRKKSVELANAAVMSQTALEKMSVDMGTVSETEQRKNEQDAKFFGVTQKQLSAGEQYVQQTESGQKLLADIQTQIKGGVAIPDIANNLASNLANAVAQNVISQQQGTEIIAALGRLSGISSIGSAGLDQYNTLTQDISKTPEMISANALGLIKARTQAETKPETASEKSIRQAREKQSGQTILPQQNYSAGLVAQSMNAYSQAKSGTDAINAQYDILVKSATTQKEINDLEKQRTESLNNNRQNAEGIRAEIEKQAKAMGSGFDTAFLTNMETAFGKDSDAYKTAEKIASLPDTTEGKVQLQMDFAGGNITPAMAEYLVNGAMKDEKFITHYEVAVSASMTGADRALIERYGPSTSTTSDNPSGLKSVKGKFVKGGSGGSGEDKVLSGLNKKLDKQQKALNVIQLKEDAINKTYDERAKALEKIQSINQRIAEQQRGQMNIAQALASGNIAAAADAAQSYREQQASRAMEDQKAALEQQRQNALNGVSFNGMSRKSLEAQIADLQMKIAQREYKTAGKNQGGGGGSSDSWTKPAKPKDTVGVDGKTYTSAWDDTQHAWLWVLKVPQPVKKTTPATPATPAAPKANAAPAAPNTSGMPSSVAAAVLADYQKKLSDWQKSVSDAHLVALGNTTEIWDLQKKGLQTNKTNADKAATAMKGVDDAAGKATTNLGTFATGVNNAKSASSGAGTGLTAAARGLANVRLAAGDITAAQRKAFPFAKGGVIPNFKSMGTDIIPAMLTPGEFVVSRPAVKKFGVNNLKAINSGSSTATSNSVYNYNVTVNAQNGANADQIANTVLAKIKKLESHKIRGNSY